MIMKLGDKTIALGEYTGARKGGLAITVSWKNGDHDTSVLLTLTSMERKALKAAL